ncbi:MAG: VOC family protein [Candidatus Nanopelagicales bacterium]
MRLDHLSYAVSHPELADTVQRLGCQLGGTFVDGGRHPAFGTQNFILPLTGGTYLEVVAALDHPAAEKAPFGQAVRRQAERGGGWLAWVVSVQDIAPIEIRLGRPSVPGQRIKPDGDVLTWHQIGISDLLRDASLPYFTQWTSPAAQHPSTVAPAVVTLLGWDICGDSDTINAWLGAPLEALPDGARLRWVDSEEAGLVAAEFRNPNGQVVRID